MFRSKYCKLPPRCYNSEERSCRHATLTLRKMRLASVLSESLDQSSCTKCSRRHSSQTISQWLVANSEKDHINLHAEDQNLLPAASPSMIGASWKIQCKIASRLRFLCTRSPTGCWTWHHRWSTTTTTWCSKCSAKSCTHQPCCE